MPAYVAMKEPCSGVIRLEGDDQISTKWQHGHISPGSVCRLRSESCGVESIELLLGDDVEVVTMEVYRVKRALVVRNQYVVPLILGDLEYLFLGIGIADIIVGDLLQN